MTAKVPGMHSDREPGQASWRWTSRSAVDACVALITLLIGTAMMFDSHRIGSGWAEGKLQPGYFPFRVGATIALVSAAILARSVIAALRAGEAFATRQQIKPVAAVLLPTLLYIAGIQWLGIYAASALFIAGFMRAGSRYGWTKAIAVGLGVAVAMFFLFEIVFLVPLPKGPVESLIGY